MSGEDREVTATASVTVSLRTVRRILVAMATIGIALGVIGLRAAYRQLPPAEDRIITVAIVVAAVAVTSVIATAIITIRRLK